MFKTVVKTMTLIAALSFSLNALAWDETTEGKIQAQSLMSISDMQKESSSLLKEIINLENQVGMSMEDSQGLVKALGEKETFATEAMTKINAIVSTVENSENTDQIMTGFEQVKVLNDQIRELTKEAHALVK